VIIYDNFKNITLYFDEFKEFLRTEQELLAVNKIKNRHIAVLINPVSGKRRGNHHVRTTLAPMLNASGISYEVFETDSPTFVENWVNQFKNKSFLFTDIICVGGDGLFSQLINAMSHEEKCHFTKTAIGLLP